MYLFLDEHSLQLIRNIENNFRNYPAYASYDIRNYTQSQQLGIQALEITKNGRPVNLFLFSPSPNGSGKIGSISIYGENIQGHYNAIKRSMIAFGLRVTSISIERGMSDYVEVIVEY